MKEQETIGDGKYVEYSYRVFDEADGKLLFEAKDTAPDCLVYGVSQDVIPGLLSTLKGMKAGDRFSVTLPPEVAFGPRFDDNIIDVPLNAFGDELPAQVKVGAVLPMMTDQGFTIQGEVKEIGTTGVKMDFNHPFAGKTVRFEGEVKSVRDATPEELQPVHGCGCGCGDHGCGDHNCGDHGCGDHGCGCGDCH